MKQLILDRVLNDGLVEAGEDEGHLRVDLSSVPNDYAYIWRASLVRAFQKPMKLTVSCFEESFGEDGFSIVRTKAAEKEVQWVPKKRRGGSYNALKNLSFNMPEKEVEDGDDDLS
jgi:hypothetical protein